MFGFLYPGKLLGRFGWYSLMRQLYKYILAFPMLRDTYRYDLSASEASNGSPLGDVMASMHGTNQHAMTLYMLTVEHDLKDILELGVRTGFTSVPLVAAAIKIGGFVTSVDIDPCEEAEEKVFAYFGRLAPWKFIWSDDMELEWDKPIDHLFIDTSHTYEHTLAELHKFEPFVREGGIITMHDTIGCEPVLKAIWEFMGDREDLRLYNYYNACGLAVIFKGEKP